MAIQINIQEPKSSMDSTFPVLIPEDGALFLSDVDFGKYLHKLLAQKSPRTIGATGNEDAMSKMKVKGGNFKSESVEPPTKADLDSDDQVSGGKDVVGTKFMDGLKVAEPTKAFHAISAELAADNKMYTENQGIAHISTNSALLDLFSELEKTVDGRRLVELLEAAWIENPLATLKIVWNARSIHLGKGEKDSFYRCLAWIKRDHPKTVIANLQWTFRSVIEKKVKREDDDSVMVEKLKGSGESDLTPAVTEKIEDHDGHDILYGVSHGYWKDLLNLLVFEVNGLDAVDDPCSILNKSKVRKATIVTHKHKRRRLSNLNPQRIESPESVPKEKSHHEILKKAAVHKNQQRQMAKDEKHKLEASRHANALSELKKDQFYRALHLTVARLFGEQLRKDMELLKSGKRKDLNKISLAAKWAPSLEGFHDKHTFIASSIAEILYPISAIREENDTREIYLKRAREHYRRFVLSPLRRALEVVERDISASTFKNINYAKVPSIAMDKNKDLFARKDFDRFEHYIEKVAEGKCRISGAVLMPATLIDQARTARCSPRPTVHPAKDTAKIMLAEKMARIQSKAIDGQWAALVQRIKDNGKLSSSIAVCDVSGSMSYPHFSDGTCPLDTSVGLALLLAEITAPPFGGSFISFSAEPAVHQVGGPDDNRSLLEKIKYIESSTWSMNTDFVAVFERLILPMAIMNKLPKEEMVKQVFVFSDMQFDAAQTAWDYSSYSGVSGRDVEKWETAYERIKRKFVEADYNVPQLIFWNLASGGGRGAPKPVMSEMEGTVLVGGYSQGMMKIFLEDGGFGGENEEEDMDEIMIEANEEDEDEGLVELKTKETKKVDPMKVIWKAIGHKAYDMLRVVD
ncbi:hypothetical protein MMC06_000685 [Schaereria dolodes]|nr:hypothetical protein [Schaereria dolodes]